MQHALILVEMAAGNNRERLEGALSAWGSRVPGGWGDQINRPRGRRCFSKSVNFDCSSRWGAPGHRGTPVPRSDLSEPPRELHIAVGEGVVGAGTEQREQLGDDSGLVASIAA